MARQDAQQEYADRRPARHGRNVLLFAAIGAGLAAAAVAVRSRTRRTEWENPPVGRFIEVDGVRLHYTERGEGPPLVLLHGNGSLLQDFDLSGLIDLAARHYRVIAFDRPGYGYSERPPGRIWTPEAQAKLLHGALRRLGVERPIVLGHSWGAMVAVALALEHPEHVRSLVLLSGYYYPTLRLDVAMLSPPAIPVIGALMRYTLSPLLGRLTWPLMKRRLFGPAQTTKGFEQFPVWMTLRPSQLQASAAESALMIPSAMRLRHRYRELTMPVVILAGQDDRFARAKLHSVRLHEELPHSRLQLEPGLGHMIHHLVPHRVMEAIESAHRAAPDMGEIAQQKEADQVRTMH